MIAKNDFPIFANKINGKDLIYLDNASTTQKPQIVIDAIVDFYSKYNSNVHRGLYSLAEVATTLYESARAKVAKFINASPAEIIFTSGATESINIVIAGWAAHNIKPDDEVIVSQMDHHSNLIAWQQFCLSRGANLKIIPLTNDYQLDLNAYQKLLNKKTKLVSILHVSNVLGVTNDIDFISRQARAVGAKVLIDAAASIAYRSIDVKKIDCDFLAFSGHKMLGPTGVGVLYIKQNILENTQPFKFGGGMIEYADINTAKWITGPQKFEAGTPPIAQAIGLGAAIDYFSQNINFEQMKKYLGNLIRYAVEELEKFDEIKIFGSKQCLNENSHILSFSIDGFHPHDVASFLDEFGICVRAGHHCAQPLHQFLEIGATVRISLFGYNTIDEIQFFIKCIENLIKKKQILNR